MTQQLSQQELQLVYKLTQMLTLYVSVGPHVCVGVQQAIDELGMSVHHSCFDLSPPVMDLINEGKVAFTIDQQQRLTGL